MDTRQISQLTTRVATIRSAAESAMDDLRLPSETEAFAFRALANMADILAEIERIDEMMVDALDRGEPHVYDRQRQTAEESVRLAFSGI